MKLVIVESPYAGDTAEAVARNVGYAQRCLKDSLSRGEAPFASHLLYPPVLNDRDQAQREQGISTGHAWMKRADLVAVYTDWGISPGMEMAIEVANEIGIPVKYRVLRDG